MVIMEVDEGLQSLLTNHPDLRLCQWSLQFCRKTEANKRTQTHGSLPNVGDYGNDSVSLKGQLYCLKMKVELTYPAWLHQQPLLHRIQSGSANKGRGECTFQHLFFKQVLVHKTVHHFMKSEWYLLLQHSNSSCMQYILSMTFAPRRT